MIIKNLFVKNSKINLQNIELDFSKNGIYIISGPNGSGKTTLLEKLVFDDYEAEFVSNEQANLFKKDRVNLFAYIPQKINSISIQVKEYICKGNKEVDNSKLIWLITNFGLEEKILTQNFKTLSGGEKEKINIISGLLKDTPYVFIDEPTNNLDDSSIHQFIELIEEEAKSKSIIIVTHDPRLKFHDFVSISVDEKVIAQLKNLDEKTTNCGIQTKNKTNTFKLSLSLFKVPLNVLALTLTLLIVFMLSQYTQLRLENGYSTDELPTENIILAYKGDYVYGELNKVYAEQEHLDISNDKIYSMIGYDDIPEISQYKGVEKVFLKDYEYFENLLIKFENNQLLDTINYISVPDVIAQNFDEQISSPYKFNFLERGRLPKDNMSEVAISKNLLIKFFGFSNDNVEKAIGTSITINDKLYTVVGLYYFDVCVLSYENGFEYGFYLYSPDTYSGFKKRNLNYKIKIDGGYPEKTNEVIIFTDYGEEKNILNYLFEKFPAENYYSNQYVKSWVKGYNNDFMCKLLLINMLFSIFVGIMLTVLNKNQYIVNKQKITDLENYYIDRKKIKKAYLLCAVLQYVFILAISLLLNHLFCSFYYVSDFIVIVDVALISIFILSFLVYATYFYEKKGKEKKNV